PTPAAAAGTNGPALAAKGRDRLPHLGYINWRKEGEYHGYNRLVVIAMQKAAQSADYAAYESYRDLVRSGPPRALRDLLEMQPFGPAVPIEEVEPIEAIVKRFVTSAMSLGALSPEAHSTLAMAVNRIG